jgi:hypothetical protein
MSTADFEQRPLIFTQRFDGPTMLYSMNGQNRAGTILCVSPYSFTIGREKTT